MRYSLSGGIWFISSLRLAYIIPTGMIFIFYLAEQLRQNATAEWQNNEWYALN